MSDSTSSVTTTAATTAAAAPTGQPRTKRFRCRSNYFLPGDLVWVRPAGLPYWPAEVVSSDEPTNTVRARLLDAPPSAALEANLTSEQRQARKTLAKKSKKESTSPHGGVAGTQSTAGIPEVEGDVVITSGQRVFFFDKLSSSEEVEACVEGRLNRAQHDVSPYEAHFFRAVLHANRLVRVVLAPEKLKPYTVCGIGVVHSLMRRHICAPRQPHTGNFEPQTAVIRLRSGLENAVRDLQGFEYIWVLFQFSYAAALATGDGQEAIRRLQGDGTTGQDENVPSAGATAAASSSALLKLSSEELVKAIGDPLATWQRRQGAANSRGFKAMIVPPRDDQLRGVFATRSPHRPNFIGISCVRLVAVHGLEVHIADHDLLHGTPVLDIKPYLPFCDAHPEAKAGWVDELDASGKSKGDHKYVQQDAQVDRIFEEAVMAEDKKIQ